MSADLLLLVLCGLAAAYGFWASLKDAPRASVAAWIAACLFLLVGMHAALVVTVTGAGEILPGHQLNPDTQIYWAGLVLAGQFLAPHPEYLLAALVAYVLAIVARPGRATVLRALPAMLVFLLVFAFVEQRPEIRFEGVSRGAQTAYVSMRADGRMLFSIGSADDVFVPILHRHDAPGFPPRPRLYWSADGQVATFTTLGGKPYFAFDRDGNRWGWLPTDPSPWPAFRQSPTDSVAFQRTVSEARVEVARILDEHGGAVPE